MRVLSERHDEEADKYIWYNYSSDQLSRIDSDYTRTISEDLESKNFSAGAYPQTPLGWVHLRMVLLTLP